MLRIGLTGGIGSGKSTVSDLFGALGVPVIDADVIAHRLSEPGAAGHRAIVAQFGHGILDSEGRLDRARLRDRVFAQPEERRRLEALLHPLVFEGIRHAIAGLSAPYCIVAIPLLVETGCRHLVDRVLVVDVPEAMQIQRVEARDGLSAARIRQILAAQCTRAERLAAADDVLNNGAGLESLREQVSALHQRYLALAGTASQNGAAP